MVINIIYMILIFVILRHDQHRSETNAAWATVQNPTAKGPIFGTRKIIYPTVNILN